MLVRPLRIRCIHLLPLAVVVARTVSAQTLFVEGFESYLTTDPTNWTRSNVAAMLVVTTNSTDLGRTHKVSEGLRSLFFRDGGGSVRNLDLKPAAAIPVSGGDEVAVAFRWSQNVVESYESNDYAGFSVAFGAGAFVEVLRDAGKLNGGGTAAAPLSYSGARLDLATVAGTTTTFAEYAVKLQVPPGTTSMRLRFSTFSSSSNEDSWLDSITVVKRPRGTVVAVR